MISEIGCFLGGEMYPFMESMFTEYLPHGHRYVRMHCVQDAALDIINILSELIFEIPWELDTICSSFPGRSGYWICLPGSRESFSSFSLSVIIKIMYLMAEI